MSSQPKKIVIIGAGFGGLAAVKALARSLPRRAAEIILLDRRNHHVFQPLLYQVATASLSPADISASIRSIVSRIPDCRVLLAEVTGIDPASRRVLLPKGNHLDYDYLIVAAGATHAYFGHDDWAPLAPGIKTLEDAIELRRRILLAFESAEYEPNERARRATLTFAIVGAGPTGVELAGAIMEIAAQTLPEDFRNINTRTTRVILFQGDDRVLPTFPPKLSAKAHAYLTRMGVEVRLNAQVTAISPGAVRVGDETFPVHNVFWAAGVKASPLAASLGADLDRSGRVIVNPDLSIPGHPRLFVVGDMAHALSADTRAPVPGVAQGALQMGRFVARIIAAEIAAQSDPTTPPKPRPAFSYHDKGSLAVVGKNRAVADLPRVRLWGFPAWFVWGLVHIAFLINFRNRIQVLFSWFWNWLFNARDARLITGDSDLQIAASGPSDPDPADSMTQEPA